MFRSFQINASGMALQRLRMDIISQNMVNAHTTRTENGGPYRRRLVTAQEAIDNKPFSEIFSESREAFNGRGVKATRVIEDPTPLKRVHDPGHPDADGDGYVLLPNVDTLKEMVDMISATRSYEAAVTSFNASKSMAMKALEIGK